jgi:hypothetical protein
MENKITKTDNTLTSLKEKQHKDLVLYSPINCFKHSHKLKTIKDVLTLPSKTLGDLKRSYGKEWIVGYISLWLIDLNENSNVKNKMSESQIEFTSERIFESYSLKITDLTLFFRNVKEGVYGQYYESLSQEKIMSWLSIYYDLRCEYGEIISQNKHSLNIKLHELPNDVLEKIFDGVGEEKVEFEKGEGFGTRKKNMISAKILSSTTEELKDYILKHDKTSQFFDETIFNEVENEIDRRNT